MEVFTRYWFCHNRSCSRDDCLRRESNMPMDTLLVRCTLEVENPCSKVLTSIPIKDELIFKDNNLEIIKEEVQTKKERKVYEYWKSINEILGDNKDIKIYIEPFVGKSKSIDKVENPGSVYGTDVNPERVEVIKKRCNGSDKNFKPYRYEMWDKVLNNSNYRGKCLILCEIPQEDSNNFKFKDFVEHARVWSENNIVLIITSRKLTKESLCEVSKEKVLTYFKNIFTE